MNLYGGKPFWPTRNGLLAAYPPLEEDIRADVAIIGGGVTGALVAWHLVDAGIECVVIDRRDVSLGSTCASTALLQYEIDVPLHRLAQRIGESEAVRAYRCSLRALKALGAIHRRLGEEAYFRALGSLQGAPNKKDIRLLEKEHAWRERFGFETELWTRTRIRRETTLPYHAILRSNEAAQMDPHRFTCALLAACAERGAKIFDRTEVTQRQVGRIVRLRTSRGCTIRANHLVIASGYETAPELPKGLVQLYSTFALVTEPVGTNGSGWPEDHVIWETSHPYHYLRKTDDDRILIGGGDVRHTSARTRDGFLRRKQSNLERRLRTLFPKIPFETAYAWCGTFAETRDGLPCLGRCPNAPDNVYYTLGYGGNGITFSLIAAEMIRDLIQGKNSEDAALFRMDRASLRES